MSVVEVKGVTKQFGRGGTTALQGIDLAIEEREFVSLIGPSGCGKSTLLRLIGDLTAPTVGTIDRLASSPATPYVATLLERALAASAPLRGLA